MSLPAPDHILSSHPVPPSGCPVHGSRRQDLPAGQPPLDEAVHAVDHLFPGLALGRLLERRFALWTEAQAADHRVVIRGGAVVESPDFELDSVAFDVLCLTRGKRDAVYEAVNDLAEKRLWKARSLGKG